MSLVQIGGAPKKLIRVFPRKTMASPDDDLSFFGPPNLFAEADEVHVDVTFTADKPRAESLAEDWKHVAPVKVGGVLDDNLLACPEDHVRKVFAMLARQKRRVHFTGGLEAMALQDYQVGLLADLKPRPACFFAYDPGDPFETLKSAGRPAVSSGF